MKPCCKCGANLGPDENFCGKCGASQPGDDTSVVSDRGSVSEAGKNSNVVVPNDPPNLAEDGSTWREEELITTSKPTDRSRGTGEIVESDESSSKTSRADSVPDKRPKPK